MRKIKRLLLNTIVKFPLFIIGTLIGGLVIGTVWGLTLDYLFLRFFLPPSSYLSILCPICLIVGILQAGGSCWSGLFPNQQAKRYARY